MAILPPLFLILVICISLFLQKLMVYQFFAVFKELLFYFIPSVLFFTSILFLSTLIFINSFLLITFGLVCSSFFKFVIGDLYFCSSISERYFWECRIQSKQFFAINIWQMTDAMQLHSGLCAFRCIYLYLSTYL